MENAPKEALVGLLFALRDERLSNGEPIKARLKTESNVKSFYTAVPNGQMGGSPREGGYRSRGSRQSGFRGPVYTGDRYNPSKPSQFYTPSSTEGTDATSTSYRRPYSGGGRSYSGRAGGGRGYGGRSNYSSSSSGPNKTTKVQPSVPPPPLVEEHFPTLAGNEAEDGVAKSTHVENEIKKENTKVDLNKNESSPVVPLKPTPTQPSLPSGGYAAAVLKAAPPSKLNQPPSKGKLSKEQSNGSSSFSPKPKVRSFVINITIPLTSVDWDDDFFLDLRDHENIRNGCYHCIRTV